MRSPSRGRSGSQNRYSRYAPRPMDLVAPPEAMSGEDPETVLRWAQASFPKLAIVASFQAESSVLIDMAARTGGPVHVITLDTGRLPQETHDMIDLLRDRSGIATEGVGPE